jgi:hypothetical protein
LKIWLSPVKNFFFISPRINDLAVTLTWTSPLCRLLPGGGALGPIRLSFLTGPSFQLFEFL